jgi:hypothetical protein
MYSGISEYTRMIIFTTKAAAAAAAEKKDNVIVWELSPKELQIIETLGGSL